MTVPTTIDAAGWLRNYLESDDGDTDLSRAMLAAFVKVLMSAEASMQCQAAYGERSDDRTNSRNGYRHRDWDTRVGTIDLAIPKLREAPTIRRGCSSTAAAPSKRWRRLWRSATSRACRHTASMIS